MCAVAKIYAKRVVWQGLVKQTTIRPFWKVWSRLAPRAGSGASNSLGLENDQDHNFEDKNYQLHQDPTFPFFLEQIQDTQLAALQIRRVG